jgi:hypothetical protein
MTARREKNNHSLSSLEETNTIREGGKDDKYPDENFDTTDTGNAENNPRIKRASQTTGNNAEEGDEDYDDENKANAD